ncbi:hypothetical protein [Pseudalkalibacillus salsuginis]|uniref:hypothetical protein n=1 Tax=Pseudalkalibacillus salsuginis TaxID=2910972 RepID=UPI001F3A99A5|nr:hypothetical protein [Pseudalkalibacillus salsuginis]MCF6409271.1 hypothetical protein [Pseudalkalibacillus salsuginis]
MEHQVQVWKGLFRPEETLHTLRESSSIQGYRLRVLILLLCSSLVFGFLFYISAAEWLKVPEAMAMELTAEQKQAASIYIGIGGAISGFALPFILIGASALSFWGFFRDIGFRKLFVLHTYLYVIILIGLAANIPYMLAFGSIEMLSPFGVGPWVNAISDHIFLTSFFGWITIFFIWHIYASIKLLMEASLKSKRYVWTVSIGLHLLFITSIAIINTMYHLPLNG